MKVGVVIPAYKEWENIGSLVEHVLTVLPDGGVIVVDDSPDERTVQVIHDVHLQSVSILHRSNKGGRGSAVIDGISFLLKRGAQTIVEMDADFSHPPSQIPELIDELERRNLDLLVASRYLPKSRIENWPVFRRIFSKCANFLTKIMLRVPVADYTNGFRVYSRRAAEIIVEHCGKMGTGFIPLSEILVQIYCRGLKVGEVPTHFVNRIRGESSLNMREIKNALIGIIKIYLLKRRMERRK